MYALPRNTVKWKTFNLMKNLFWSITTDTPTMYEVDGKTYRFVEFTALGFDTGSMVADPMFADAEHYDFTLAPDSPAFKLGFRAIDTSDVGPRR